MRDRYQRTIEYLRVSVTDRCNLRCRYCMPEEGIKRMRHEEILTFDEITAVVRALAKLGVHKVRLTGGEPLVRRDITDLVAMIHAVPGIDTVAMTTNAVLLADKAEALKRNGLTHVNISVDSLNGETFADIARSDAAAEVRRGIEAAQSAGLRVKLNCVPLRGVNEDEIIGLIDWSRQRGLPLRFIELMPIGCAAASGLKGIPSDELRETISKHYGALLPHFDRQNCAGPASYYDLPEGGVIGFIDAIDHPFCTSCNRVRLTANGFLKLCLHARDGLDLRPLLRSGVSGEDLEETIARAVRRKPERHHFGESGGDSRFMYQVGG